MDDLIAFLRTRLDDDEQAALDWQRHKQALTEQFMNDPRRKDVRFRREPVTEARLAEHAFRDRFDPARMLLEVEAKRRMLAWLQRQQAWAEENNLWAYDAEEPLKLLAAPYADHEDYRADWRP